MPSLTVRWGVVPVIIVEVVVVVFLTTTTARLAATNASHSTPCPNITADNVDFVNNTDGCVKASFDYRDKNDPTRIETVCHSDMFCINTKCAVSLQHYLYSKGAGCVVPNDFLEKLNRETPYIFCGRFIDDEHVKMALTAIPTVYDRNLKDAIFKKYASITHIHQPNVDVQGAWQQNTSAQPPVYYVEENSIVKLTCTYNYDDHGKHSKMRLQWSNQIGNLTSHGISGAQVLEKQFSLSDSGIYECRGRLKKVKYYDPFQLNITVIATDATYLTTNILNPNVTERVGENHTVQWEIPFIAHPEPDFQWKKTGTVLLDSRKKTSPYQFRNYEMDVSVEEGLLTLNLHHPKLTDNGEYTLEASLPHTNITTTTTMFLTVQGKPQNVQIESPRGSHVFYEDDEFSLTCSAEGYPKPNLTLHFVLHNDTYLLDNIENHHKYNQLGNSSMGEDDHRELFKRRVHWFGVAEEPGWYQCKAENDLGQDYSPRMLFLVTDGEYLRPMSLRLEISGEVKGAMDKPVPVFEGKDFKLTCRANKMTAKAPLTWTLNDSTLDPATQKKWSSMKVTVNETRLSFVSTVWATGLHRSAGNFSIRCADQAGNSTNLTINVQEMVKPKWRGEGPGGDYNKNKNENLTLSCPADGIPPPDVIWKKGAELVESINWREIKGNDLVFEILSYSDSGTYTCEVSNKAGSLSASFSVTVQDPDDQKTVIILTAVVGLLIAALVVMSVFLCKKIYQARIETLKLQLREGYPSSLNPDIPLEQQAELLP